MSGARIGTVRVVSKRMGGTAPTAGETVIDVDRSHPVLGNRHVLKDHRDAGQRARVLDAHRRDVAADKAACGPITHELGRLARRVASGERIALRCWCAPDDCHADLYRAEILALAGLPPAPAAPAQQSLF